MDARLDDHARRLFGIATLPPIEQLHRGKARRGAESGAAPALPPLDEKVRAYARADLETFG